MTFIKLVGSFQVLHLGRDNSGEASADDFQDVARDKISNPLREPIANPRNGLCQVSSFGFVFEDVEETFESCFLLSFYLFVEVL